MSKPTFDAIQDNHEQRRAGDETLADLAKRICDTCAHFMDDDFAPWCLKLKCLSEEGRALRADCGPSGNLWEPRA